MDRWRARRRAARKSGPRSPPGVPTSGVVAVSHASRARGYLTREGSTRHVAARSQLSSLPHLVWVTPGFARRPTPSPWPSYPDRCVPHPDTPPVVGCSWGPCWWWGSGPSAVPAWSSMAPVLGVRLPASTRSSEAELTVGRGVPPGRTRTLQAGYLPRDSMLPLSPGPPHRRVCASLFPVTSKASASKWRYTSWGRQYRGAVVRYEVRQYGVRWSAVFIASSVPSGNFIPPCWCICRGGIYVKAIPSRRE